MLITTQPAVKFAGFSREREIRIREIRRVGREERHQKREAMLKARGTARVRIPHPSQDSMTIQTSMLGTQKRRGATALNQYIAGREATDEGPHVSENVIRPGGRFHSDVRVR